jgi:hypothetical protein
MSLISQVGRMLLPGRLTTAARRVAAADFKQKTGCRTVLLLRVPDEEQELAWGLNQVYGGEPDVAGEQPKVLDFHTAIAGVGVGGAGRQAMAAASSAARTGVRGFGLEDLMGWIAAARCFAIALEQREGAFSGRISLGRARNKDLSLRSQNISKLHAWFEYDAAGTLMVADAGSKNGTKVGGVRLVAREMVPIAYGTEIRFGPIEAMVCSLEQFWEVASVV